jgi:hypothetical protein
MEARQYAEFTGVELTGGAELAALVEKGAACPCTGEARGGREARWRGRKTGCRALARRRCWLAERGGAMKREVRWRGKRGGERYHRGSTTEHGRGELSRHYSEVIFFLF